jgi:FKBP-type peptidyl-prolyl cis-trans isomerase FklB
LDDNAMVLYSLGYEMGKDIKGQQLEFNQGILLQGINDALAGNEPLIDKRTQHQAMAAINNQRAEENLHKGKAFLAENAQKEGVTTLPSGLQYRAITTGEGPIPGPEDRVTVEFRGSLIDGTEFLSSKKLGKPATLKVNRIIKGLSEALKLMPTGSKWVLYIPPELAYGNRSPGVKVPAYSTLIYEIELLSVDPSTKTKDAAKQASPETEPAPDGRQAK